MNHRQINSWTENSKTSLSGARFTKNLTMNLRLTCDKLLTTAEVSSRKSN